MLLFFIENFTTFVPEIAITRSVADIFSSAKYVQRSFAMAVLYYGISQVVCIMIIFRFCLNRKRLTVKRAITPPILSSYNRLPWEL